MQILDSVGSEPSQFSFFGQTVLFAWRHGGWCRVWTSTGTFAEAGR